MKNLVHTLSPRRSRFSRIVITGWVFLLLSWASPAASIPADSAGLEYRIKGAFLYNFIKFVEWPASAFSGDHAPFVIGILDDKEESASIVTEVLANKTTPSGRPIEVRLLADSDERVLECHLLFVSQAAKINWTEIVTKTSGRPILLVGERDGFAQQGGMMNLMVTGDAVRCEVNLRRAQRASLKLSGRLVNVARLVRDADNEP